jgi:uncharacterized phiE125 gp8 family phage protein
MAYNIYGINTYQEYLPYGRIKVSQARTAFAISLSEAKTHLRIDSSYSGDDTYITELIKIAQDIVEKQTNVLMSEVGMDFIADIWPGPFVDLGFSGNAVTHFKYYNNSNVLTTLSENTDFIVSNKDYPEATLRLYPVSGSDWPDLYDRPDAINIRFTAGPSSQTLIPLGLKQAMYLIIGRYYEMRQDVITGTIVYEVPLAAEHLMNQYKQPTI